MKNILTLILLFFYVSGNSKEVVCDFKIQFKIDAVDDINRCSFFFLASKGIKFSKLIYTVKNQTVKIQGKASYNDKEWLKMEFPILNITKKIKGSESFQRVNNSYMEFKDLYIENKNIDVSMGTLCAIEKTLEIHYYFAQKKLVCSEDSTIPTWKIFEQRITEIKRTWPNR